MIEVKDLQKSFGDTKVLKGITTTFETGKTNLIIGQSGSGKTVFLKCLLGLFNYEEGSIAYDGSIFAKHTFLSFILNTVPSPTPEVTLIVP